MRPAKQQLHQLDVLRGICALLVVLFHIQFQFPGRGSQLVRNGDLFVDFFFVLSGFIMLHSYRSLRGGRELFRFLGARLFRVYPLHLVMLGVFLAYEVVQYALVRSLGLPTSTPPFETNNGYALALGLTLLNGVGLHPLSFNVPSWSISTEFWSYLAFGLTLTLVSGRRLHLYLAFGMLASTALLVLASQPTPSLSEDPFYFFPRCVFGFFLGALLRLALPTRRADEVPSARAGMLAQCAALAALATLIAVISKATVWLELVVPLSFAALIAALVHWPNTLLIRAIDLKPLRWMGAVSYSIYMVHMIIVLVVQAFVRIALHAPTKGSTILVSPALGCALLALCLGGTLWAASLTYRFIEEPGRRLGRRLLDAEPRRSAATLEVAAVMHGDSAHASAPAADG